jgi:putative heme iron utilization protein
MDESSTQLLARLISRQRTAALGTLRGGAPLVSLVLFAAEEDFTSFIIHVSSLALHTRDMVNDPRVSLMIAEPDLGQKDPQTLARVSISGEAAPIEPGGAAFTATRGLYLDKFPEAAMNFQLADFSMYRIIAHSARYVADFGKIYNLKPGDLRLVVGD